MLSLHWIFALSVFLLRVDGLVIKSAERNIDLSSQLARYSTSLVIENDGSTAVSSFLLASDQQDAVLSFISVKLSGVELKTTKTSVPGYSEWQHYSVHLNSKLQPQKSISVNIEEVYSSALKPFPAVISQSDSQLVLFNGNHYVLSPYTVLSQKTKIVLASKNVESYTKIKPSQLTDSTITLGPFDNTPAYSVSQLTVHSENNAPFLHVTRLQRDIHVSHWGYIAVEETLDVRHVGAQLGGAFSRLDYQQQRRSGVSSVQSFRTSLPASAVDVYYRDDIGNVSTSNMRVRSDEVLLELRPRFPLFGGWKTHYTIGYRVPVYQYLFRDNTGALVLRMRLLDHVFDNMVVDQLAVTVVLPEGSSDIQLDTPYPVQRQPDSLLRTYLDTTGRPVVSFGRRNLVDEHIAEFTVRYRFASWMYVREPLMLITAFVLVFLVFVVWSRLDFSIGGGADGALAKTSGGQRAAAVGGARVSELHAARCHQYQKIEDAVTSAKASKDLATLQTVVKSATASLKTDTAAVAGVLDSLRATESCAELSERVAELQKLDKQLKDLLVQHVTITEKLIAGRLSKANYVEQDGQLTKKKKETFQRMEVIEAAM